MPIRNENIGVYSDAFFQFLKEQEDKEEKTWALSETEEKMIDDVVSKIEESFQENFKNS